MRYLNKIIFINSASIKYSEIKLDGNVHFIGTNNTGKSTILRAILFFYNADTLRLGIPAQKKSYLDYYFAHSNSYIIYEVEREDGKFCVVSYKSQNKVCFRFFNGEFKQEFFVDKNGNVPENWEGIAQQLDAYRIAYTKRKIDEYKEYRDIIYGNNADKKHEFRKYSLLESKDYQQVPKTIQNVFLNSKMEADFIKKIIILSLDNDVRIDLNQYAHHLNDFDTQLTDIRKFKFPSTITQAENIAKLFIAIRHLEREKISLAKELAFAVNENEKQEPEISERLKTQQEKETVFKNKLSRAKELFDEKAKKINGDIRIQQENLKKAKELSDKYERKNINQVIAKFEKKADYEKEKSNLLNEKTLLSAQFADLEAKFKALVDSLENDFKDFLNGKDADKNNIKSEFQNFREKTFIDFNKQISNIREEQKNEIDDLRSIWEDKKQVVADLKLQKERIHYTRFFENEIAVFNKEIQELEKKSSQLPTENEHLENQMETIQKQWELDEQNLQKDLEHSKEKLEEIITSLEAKIAEITNDINNSKSSLYGWLSENYPNWENTIGKVVDKNVLFNSELNPRFTEQSNHFYGVEIDLNEINKTVKTVADYEREKTEFEEQIQALKKEIAELHSKLEEDKGKLKTKYQPRIREKKDTIRGNEYKLEQAKSKLSETIIKRDDLIANAEKERKIQLESIKIEIDKAIESAKTAEQGVSNLEETLTKKIKSKEKERDKIIETEKERVDESLQKIDLEIKAKQAETESRKTEIVFRKNKELSEKGADTKRLEEIEQIEGFLKSELNFIEENTTLVIEFQKDKREYIDRSNDFKQEKQKQEKQLEIESLKYENQKASLEKELNDILSIVADLKNTLDRIKEDINLFSEFKESDCFKSIAQYFGISKDEVKSEKQVKRLIDEIKEIHYEKLNNRKDELRSNSTDFLGKFSENNIFKFKKQIASENDLLNFAEMLSDFVEERKIDRIEKEVNERFALIVSTIGTEVGNLLAQSGKIQSIVTKINNDFTERESIGAGVIKKIELKIEDSKSEIVHLLLSIKKYNDENADEFGTRNLFSSDNQEKKNKEAVDLLKQFVKKINEARRDYVTLSDSFELKFRIIENQNDTGWQEKLTNVGSEGTDILVKAMVNIMLLNVFKESVSKRFKDFRLHCMMDEIGKLHPNNVRGILKFANDRNILLINGSPIENDALAFHHIYKLNKDEKSHTKVKRLITQHFEE
ncbi:MAG: ATP-binding protein [Chitinophagales bacterium]|nr:ATP-binding protein [Chitinophagales bacterium]